MSYEISDWVAKNTDYLPEGSDELLGRSSSAILRSRREATLSPSALDVPLIRRMVKEGDRDERGERGERGDKDAQGGRAVLSPPTALPLAPPGESSIRACLFIAIA